MNKKPEGQIFRIDARSTFAEALSDFYEKGNMQHIRAIAYDSALEAGSRTTSKVDLFIAPSIISGWRLIVETGAIRTLIKKSQESGKPIEELTQMGGTGIKKLEAYRRQRPDGKAEFRSLYFCAGRAKDLVLCAVCGPGNESEKGLIQPAGKMEQFIQVPMSTKELYQMLWTMDENYKAFLVSRYLPFHKGT